MMSRNMAHSTHPINDNSDLLLWAIALSLGLHSAALVLLPGFSFSQVMKKVEPLTVELQQLPPPVVEPEKPQPPKPPEPPKPQPKLERVPPKVIPQRVTPPPLPSVVPQHDEPPPPVTAAEPPVAAPSPPSVVAVEQKATEPPPVFTAPVPTPSPPVSSEETLGEIRAAYGRLLNGEFSKHTKYPAVAAMKGWEGKVKIKLQIDKQGNVLGTPEVTDGSGYKMLDEDAVKTILKCSPLPLPPSVLFVGPVFINTVIDYHKQR
jgi:periplasmic protein TonB